MSRTRRIRVNDRDVQTLATLGEYGVLDRELCHALCYGAFSAEWCRQNLSRLAAAGLVRITTLRVWHDDGPSRGGRIPQLLSLTEDGAEIVRVRTGVYPRRVLRSEPSAATFWHRLQTVRVRVAFDRAAASEGLPSPRWILEQDLRPDAPRDAMPQHRRVLCHAFERDGTVVTCRPDAAAVLDIPHPSGDPQQATALAIHFEIDRSSEGFAQCQGKVPGYAALFEERAYLRYWPDLRNPAYRVFFVVPSRQRIETLAAAFRTSPVATCFRFCTFGDCLADRVLTHPVWCDVHGTAMTLYRKNSPDTYEFL
jgi:hypothetical protein